MTTTRSEQYLFGITPGVQPATDKTALSTEHYTSSLNVRFFNNQPHKMKGWETFDYDYEEAQISGTVRTIYSTRFSNRIQTLIGTNEKLYNLYGDDLVNITPLVTSNTAAANSLATHYATLGNNPIATTNGSKFLVVTDSEAAKFRVGDTYTLSGATTTNGVPDTEINTDHLITAVGAGTVTIRVSTAATSTGSGGGASVVRSSGLITLTKSSHGLLDGDRIDIDSAADTGGITAAQINIEHIIRNKTANTFDFMTSGTATSSVSSAGGASTTYNVEIADGNENETAGQGYGAGLYGVGLYGVPKTSSSGREYPRIWFFDRFGDLVIGTPGEGTGLYEWDGSTSVAPVLVTNAPTAINYAFVSNNIIITFGDSGVANRIKTSDQGDRTNWTSSSTNQVFVDDIEGAQRFTSHAAARGTNLIFTENQTYTFRKIPKEAGVWEIKEIDPVVGIIAPMARVVVQGVPYWMGVNNFYMWRGANVEIIPANTQAYSTCLKYVFDDINTSQKSKIFAEYNEKYQYISFHYPSNGMSEPNRKVCFSVKDFSWWIDTISRTATEYPNVLLSNPRMANGEIIYVHETGNDDDGSAMAWSLTTNLRALGKDSAFLTAVIPDSIQTGDINLNLQVKEYPQSSSNTFNNDYTISPTSDRIPVRGRGKYWEYTLSGEVLDQEWIGGTWAEELQKGSRA